MALSNAERQRRWRQRQKEKLKEQGKRFRGFWVTPQEERVIRAYLEHGQPLPEVTDPKPQEEPGRASRRTRWPGEEAAWLPLAEAGEIIGTTDRTLHRWIKAGKVPEGEYRLVKSKDTHRRRYELSEAVVERLRKEEQGGG